MSLRDKVLDKIRKTMGWDDNDITDDINSELLDKEIDWNISAEVEKELLEDKLKRYKKNIERNVIWHCPACGFVMRYINETDDWWHNDMLDGGSDHVFCTNDKCTWNDTPLRIHHPTSYDRSAGDSWSISWLK